MPNPYYTLLESLPYSIKRRLEGFPSYIEGLIEDAARDIKKRDQYMAGVIVHPETKESIKFILLVRAVRETLESGIYFATEAGRLAKQNKQAAVQIGRTVLSEDSEAIRNERLLLSQMDGLVAEANISLFMRGDWKQTVINIAKAEVQQDNAK
jgi:hypothetical protein